MFQQLVQRLMAGVPASAAGPLIVGLQPPQALARVLEGDPFDLLLHMEQIWHVFNPWPGQQAAGPARQTLWQSGDFNRYVPTTGPAWDHFGYSYALENTRAVQILRRVVREYRAGEGLGVPSVATQQWLNITETLLFGAGNPLTAWLSTSAIRSDAEAVRRNAYWRMFGLDLAFGTDDNRPPSYDKANAANGAFLKLFEELLYELWRAISNIRNLVGENQTDDDRIYTLADELGDLLRARRQLQVLGREELAAAAVLGWIDLTLSSDTPIVVDLRARATSPAERLRLIGERVGLAPHSKSEALFSMATPLSYFLRTIEAGVVSGPTFAWVLYTNVALGGVGDYTRRVITEWSAATGKSLKTLARPMQTQVAAGGRELANVR